MFQRDSGPQTRRPKAAPGTPWTDRQVGELAVPGYAVAVGQPFVDTPSVTYTTRRGEVRRFDVPALVERAGVDPSAGLALLWVAGEGYAALNRAKAMPGRMGIDPGDEGGVATHLVVRVLGGLFFELAAGVQDSLDAEVTRFRGRGSQGVKELYLDSGLLAPQTFWQALLTMARRALEYGEVFERGSLLSRRQRTFLDRVRDDAESHPEDRLAGSLDHQHATFAAYKAWIAQVSEPFAAVNREFLAPSLDTKRPLDTREMSRLVHQVVLFRCQQADWPRQLPRLDPTRVDQRVAVFLLHQLSAIDLDTVRGHHAGQDELAHWAADARSKPAHDVNGLLTLILWSVGFHLRGAPYNPNSMSAYVKMVGRELEPRLAPERWRWQGDLPLAAWEWMP